MSEVSGLAVVTIPKFIKERFGTEGWEQLLPNLEKNVKETFEKTILVNDWFDLDQFMIRPMQEVARLFYENEQEAALDLGKFSADFGLRGVLKVFVKMGSINYFVKRAASVIPNYYRPAAMEVARNEKGFAEIRLTEFTNMHPIVEYRIQGWMQRAFEICGASESRVDITGSLLKNEDATVFAMHWK